MKKSFKATILLISTALLFGCSKQAPTSFPTLNEVLEPTETTITERTESWYADQDAIRKEVLAVCFDYFHEKAQELGGTYQSEFQDDVYGKYVEIPDCISAWKGEIKGMTATGAMPYQYQSNELEKTINTPESQEHINNIARDVANKLNEMDQRNATINNEGTELIKDITN